MRVVVVTTQMNEMVSVKECEFSGEPGSRAAQPMFGGVTQVRFLVVDSRTRFRMASIFLAPEELLKSISREDQLHRNVKSSCVVSRGVDTSPVQKHTGVVRRHDQEGTRRDGDRAE